VATCPENLLLWFHRVPWDHKMRSGRTLWTELCFTYNAGVAQAERIQAAWQSVADKIDRQRHAEVARRLEIQVTDARKWRDECLKYFQQFSRMPI
jgi:alpha-glucuronidase